MFELVVVYQRTDQWFFFFCRSSFKLSQNSAKYLWRHVHFISLISRVHIAFPIAFPLFSSNSLRRSGLVSCILFCPLLLGRGLQALTRYSGPGLLLGVASLVVAGSSWCSGPY
jgi:hypothetical protein